MSDTLISFKVENYRSFGDEQRLTMIPGPVRNHPEHIFGRGDSRQLCAAMVFGANASGKTNLVRAMYEARAMVVDGAPIGAGEYDRASDRDRSSEPTGFEFTFRTGDEILVYGFEIVLSRNRIESEWLDRLGPDGAVSVFLREGDEVSTDLRLEGEDRMRFDVYSEEATDLSRLLIRTLSRGSFREGSGMSAVSATMDWLSRSLIVIPAGGIPMTADRSRGLLDRIMSYGTGVTSVSFRRIGSEESGIPRTVIDRVSQDLAEGTTAELRGSAGVFRVSREAGGLVLEKAVFDHGGREFDFNEESDGTRRLFDLSSILDGGSGDGITFVVDELDRSMHPQLTRRFVGDFLRMAAGCERQLIATVHESRLMDLNLLRRDEIWFVDRPGMGDSQLYSLEDFAERGDRRVDRSYMDGRYGAVPCFRRLFPDLERSHEAHQQLHRPRRCPEERDQERLRDLRGVQDRDQLHERPLGIVRVPGHGS